MPIYTATLIHDGNCFLPKNSAIKVSETGEILDVLFNEIPTETIHLEGLLCPGFINTHCHLELSYLHNTIPKHTGLVDFLLQINAQRFANTRTQSEKEMQIANAEKQMLANGIIAVGDISNTLETLPQKQLGNLQYHTFVEIMGILDENASERLEKGLENLFAFKQFQEASLVPHAPYSVSDAMFHLINAVPENAPISIHNQECEAENEWTQNGSGSMARLMQAILQKPFTMQARNTSSLMHYVPMLTNANKVLFVHNTYTTAEDVLYAKEKIANRFWVLCPRANAYIENTLPSIIPFLLQQQETICLGTDSLASNEVLCIYSEMLALHAHFTTLSTEKLLQFATQNGAKALNMAHLGNFYIHKKPGLVHISNWMEMQEMPLLPNIEVI